MKKLKKKILVALLRSVACIASKEYQKRVWIEARGPEVDDFDETVNDFSYCYDGVIQELNELNINQKQAELIKEFQKEFKIFYDDNDLPQLFIDTPEWTRITEMAEDLLQAFNYKKRKN